MDFAKLSEKDLLYECIHGNKKSWNAFVERYTNLIYHTIHKAFKTYHSDYLYQDLEDIHNGIFLSLMENGYKKLKQYKGINGCSVSSWLMVVTTNFTLNYFKRQKPYVPLEDTTGNNMSVLENIPNPKAQPDEKLAEAEHGEILGELIKDLNANDRLFLKLYYDKELPPEEIAEIMNLTVSAIYSKKNRIREKLKKIAKKKKILQGI